MASSKHAPILTLSKNLAIRLLHPSDAPSLRLASDNRNIWHNLSDHMASPYTLADAEWWIAQCNDEANWAEILHFDQDGHESKAEEGKVPTKYAIVRGDEVVGTIGLIMGSDVYRRTAKLGYWLCEPLWGQGIMSEAVPRFCDWAWATFPGLLRIQAETYERNETSGRILAKARFKLEGRLRCGYFKEGKVGDLLCYGLVRENGGN